MHFAQFDKNFQLLKNTVRKLKQKICFYHIFFSLINKKKLKYIKISTFTFNKNISPTFTFCSKEDS